MDGNGWRLAQEDLNIDSNDWRTQLTPESRQRIVNKIMETLKRHLPFSGPEGIVELKKIAARFEEKVYTAATNQPDYLRRISFKMLAMETKSQTNVPNSLPLNPAAGSQNQPDPGLWDWFPTVRTVQQMMETTERVLEDPLAYNTYPSLWDDNEASYRRGRSPWEVKEGEEEFKMRFDMPGMTKKDVKVFVEEKMLVVKAEKLANNSEGESGEEDWFVKSHGRYSSRMALPDNVDVEKIKAEVKDGVLYILIPKAKASSKILVIDVK